MKHIQKRSKIVYTLLAFMLLAATAPLVVSSWKLISINKSALTSDQKIIQLQTGHQLATEISIYLQSCRSQIEAIKRSLPIHNLPLDFNNERTKHLLEEHVKASENLFFLRVVNASGKGIRAGYEFTGDRTERLLDEAFVRGLSESYWFLSTPYYVEEIDQLVGVLSRSIIVNGTVAGVISGVVGLEPIYQFVKESSVSGNTAYVVDSRGRLIAHPDKARIKANEDLSNSEIVKEMQRLGELVTTTKPFVEHSGNHPIPMLATIVLMKDVGWGVIVQTEERLAYYPATIMIRQTVQWTLIAIALAALLSFGFSRQIGVPIRLLAETTHSIAQGNFSERVNVRSNNELGELAENFNLMVEKIQNTIHQLQEALDNNKQLFLGTISALAAAIDAKDPYTRGHSERVSRYSVEIARTLGLPEDEVEKVKIGALLHDVGKIGIEDHILKKPAKFTPEEYEIMKQHPTKGARIMGSIPQLKEVIPAMFSHHEQVDGNGYPLGLKGDDIPLIAKIISVSDCFDAMTLKRVYQSQFEVEYVLNKIAGFVGTRYDDVVVKAFLQAYKEGRIKVPDVDPPIAEPSLEKIT